MELPDYQGGSLVNLMASLQMGLGGEQHDYAPLRQLGPTMVDAHRQVVLWVIDGMGYEWLLAHPQAVHLNAALQGRMTSVYPPTTASAITTFLTGDAPQQHGLTGWFIYFRELGTVLTVLPGRTRFGGTVYDAAEIDVVRLLGHRPFSQRIGVESYQLSPSYMVDSPFNLAHLGDSTRIGFRTLEELCAHTLAIARRPGRRYISLYWPELDTFGHRFGIHSQETARHLLQLDRQFAALCEGLQGTDTLLIVCADHGQIDTTPEQTLQLEDYPELESSLVLPLSGEPRSAYCYLRSGCESRFDEMAAKAFDGLASVYESRTLLEQNWFGLGTPHPRLADRIGDRVLLMQRQAIIRDSLAQEKPYPLIGVHGGLSSAELWVPLITASC